MDELKDEIATKGIQGAKAGKKLRKILEGIYKRMKKQSNSHSDTTDKMLQDIIGTLESRYK